MYELNLTATKHWIQRNKKNESENISCHYIISYLHHPSTKQTVYTKLNPKCSEIHQYTLVMPLQLSTRRASNKFIL